MMDSQKLQELLSGAKLPWTGDRYDGTVKYHIINSGGEVVYRTDFNKDCDVGFEDESGFTPDMFMSMINYLPELLAENIRLKEATRWKSIEKDGLPEILRDVIVVFFDGQIHRGIFLNQSIHRLGKYGGIQFYSYYKENIGVYPELLIYWKYDSLPEVGE